MYTQFIVNPQILIGRTISGIPGGNCVNAFYLSAEGDLEPQLFQVYAAAGEALEEPVLRIVVYAEKLSDLGDDAKFVTGRLG